MMKKQMSRLPNFPPRAVARFQHEHAIIDTLKQIDDARAVMQEATRRLDDLIRTDPEGEWQQRWNAFQAAGGVSSDELCRWMVLQKQIRQSRKQKKHLRIIGGTAAHADSLA